MFFSIKQKINRKIPCVIGFFFITILFCFTVSADDLYLSPSQGPAGTSIQISANIYNDVDPANYEKHYGLSYAVVWDVRPADIYNPNLWGYDNPIGSAYINYNGALTGSATIPYDAEPGTYYVYAALDDFPYDPDEWYDSDSDGIGDNTDPHPYDAENTDYQQDQQPYQPPTSTPGFESIFFFSSLFIIFTLKKQKRL